MKSYALFLHGRYDRKSLPFYRKLSEGKCCLAVDGGLNFFEKTRLAPRAIIGDFDSIRQDPRRKFRKADVIVFPVKKDKTDTQLAVEYAVSHGAQSIDIVQPTFGEADHFTGNLMLLASLIERPKTRRLKLRLVNAAYEIIFLRNGSCTFTGAAGDTVSVVPLSERISLTCTGTAFLADQMIVHRGETTALRNRISARKCTIMVRGQAFVFHQFDTGRAA